MLKYGKNMINYDHLVSNYGEIAQILKSVKWEIFKKNNNKNKK